jgi:hypothetical protein
MLIPFKNIPREFNLAENVRIYFVYKPEKAILLSINIGV